MQWIPGDRCVLNEAVFSRFIKSFGPKVCRKPEVYVVADIDPYQAVVIIVGKSGPTPVLATWILPVEERDWKGCRTLVGNSSGPTALVRNLHRSEANADAGTEADSIPDPSSKSTIVKTLVQGSIVMGALLYPVAAVIAFLMFRAWDKGSASTGF